MKNTERPRGSYSANIIAQRTLHSLDDRAACEVIVHRPVREQVRDEEWSCTIEFRFTGAKPSMVVGRGLDSLQALLIALGGVRGALGEHMKNLTWLGAPREIGFPKLIHDHDPDFLTLIDHLVEAEYARQLLLAKRQHALRSGKTSRRKS